MSNRLKKRKPHKPRQRVKEGRLVEVTTYAGRFSGRARGKNGWLELQSYEINPDMPPDQVMQRTACPDTGQSFAKPFEGHYRHLSEDELKERLETVEEFIRQMGGFTPPDMGQPLWLRVEFLENVIDFELNPPCGCLSRVEKRVGRS